MAGIPESARGLFGQQIVLSTVCGFLLCLPVSSRAGKEVSTVMSVGRRD